MFSQFNGRVSFKNSLRKGRRDNEENNPNRNKFKIDQCVNYRFKKKLRERGYDCDDLMEEQLHKKSTDPIIFQAANRDGRIVVTADKEFAYQVRDGEYQPTNHWGFVLVHFGRENSQDYTIAAAMLANWLQTNHINPLT